MCSLSTPSSLLCFLFIARPFSVLSADVKDVGYVIVSQVCLDMVLYTDLFVEL